MKKAFGSILLLTILLSGSVIAQPKGLDYYLKMAGNNIPNLLELQNQAKSIGLDSARLEASYGPQFSANSNLLYAPVIDGWGYDKAITNGQNIVGGVTLSKEIIGKNNLQTRLSNFTVQKQQLNNKADLSKKHWNRQSPISISPVTATCNNIY
ncbi:hypothetical protein FSB73_21545 [Arachidicoccus ginsenosidivorans]|uniref:TolC family protein n=1 Tax=Arachidicoccus ginsenosidivorans TaxID=496057 RepID=A0A5B8VSJ6_9BACT|nr:hypothetical protein [Arachidicoccus ginsenosidivorans]QEC73862.1 hypothetical protein FSB73_21545 [Arachidicoccus ginsenosidivorans]